MNHNQNLITIISPRYEVTEDRLSFRLQRLKLMNSTLSPIKVVVFHFNPMEDNELQEKGREWIFKLLLFFILSI